MQVGISSPRLGESLKTVEAAEEFDRLGFRRVFVAVEFRPLTL
jgi:hypothetical protein